MMNKGFALLVAILTTGILLLISFVVVDIALKQLIITNSGQQSELAFYAADSGVECAYYWDVKDPTNPQVSAFATSTSGTITCSTQTISTGSEIVPTVPVQTSLIGGGGNSNPTSIFSITFANGTCAIVQVTKNNDNTTRIDSRGYNTCSAGGPKRFERGVTLTY